MMTVYESLTLMLAFGSLVIAILDRKKRI
ncbi:MULTISPECIES: putative holin-like toxin [Paenibacillus]